MADEQTFFAHYLLFLFTFARAGNIGNLNLNVISTAPKSEQNRMEQLKLRASQV